MNRKRGEFSSTFGLLCDDEQLIECMIDESRYTNL